MSLPTIVEDYTLAAMRGAVYERFENGVIAATIPEFVGVVAFGARGRDCVADLCARLEDWVQVSLANGYRLPVIDGIDLNTREAYVPAGYHDRTSAPTGGEYFATDEEFQAALADHSKPTE